jgi:hypothetical protein
VRRRTGAESGCSLNAVVATGASARPGPTPDQCQIVYDVVVRAVALLMLFGCRSGFEELDASPQDLDPALLAWYPMEVIADGVVGDRTGPYERPAFHSSQSACHPALGEFERGLLYAQVLARLDTGMDGEAQGRAVSDGVEREDWIRQQRPAQRLVESRR